jgi:hypothetical protein
MRLTRAAMRAQAQDETDAISIHEDIDASPQTSSPELDDNMRPVLRDITEDNTTTADEVAELKQSTRSRKPKASKKKGKAAKKDDNIDLEPELAAELAEAPVVTDTPGEETPEEPKELSINSCQLPETLAPTTPLVTDISECNANMTQTPERHVPLISNKTPKFDPDLHIAAPEPETVEEQQDSFVESIKTRSPVKPSQPASPDSFVKSIKSRSPAKSISRIEDSVEAMDALEDAIEEFSGKLPLIDHIECESPIKQLQPSPKSLPPSARKTALQTKATKPAKEVKLSPAKSKPAQLKSAPPRTNSGRVSTVKPTAKGPTINKSTVRPTTKPAPMPEPKMMSFSNSPLKPQPNLGAKRTTSGVLSTSRPAFVPAKSTKPPTKSTFMLPGEAYQAKMKAQREAQAEKEAADPTKKAFKARPAPNMTSRPSFAPRENKASLARKSSVPIAGTENKENEAPSRSPSKPAAAPTSKMDIKKTRPTAQANSSIRRTTTTTPPSKAVKKPSPIARPSMAPKPAPRPSMAPRVASITKPKTSSPSALSSAVVSKPATKVIGREVYGRTKLERERMEQEKREKEEAAKKARAEAAERGRQASRDWAEKQRLKALRDKAAKMAQEGGAAEVAVVEAA